MPGPDQLGAGSEAEPEPGVLGGDVVGGEVGGVVGAGAGGVVGVGVGCEGAGWDCVGSDGFAGQPHATSKSVTKSVASLIEASGAEVYNAARLSGIPAPAG